MSEYCRQWNVCLSLRLQCNSKRCWDGIKIRSEIVLLSFFFSSLIWTSLNELNRYISQNIYFNLRDSTSHVRDAFILESIWHRRLKIFGMNSIWKITAGHFLFVNSRMAACWRSSFKFYLFFRTMQHKTMSIKSTYCTFCCTITNSAI